MVVWMMGEYCNIGDLISKMIPTIFKYLAQRFNLESVETKLQIVNACVKVVIETISFPACTIFIRVYVDDWLG